MSPWLRGALALMGAGALLLAAGFLLRWGWATALWPVGRGPYDDPMGRAFAASVLASVGVSPLWIALTREARAIAGGALDIAVIAGGGALAALVAGRGTLAAAAAATALLGLLIAARTHRLPWRDRRPLPGFVLWAFRIFVLILVAEATLLLLGLPHAFPWRLARGNQVVYGLVFLGAAAFFLYALRERVWGAAGSLLAGFLAYDLVLIGPLLGHLDSVQPAKWPALLVYLAAVSASGLLALWTLFLHPATRLGAPPALPPAGGAR